MRQRKKRAVRVIFMLLQLKDIASFCRRLLTSGALIQVKFRRVCQKLVDNLSQSWIRASLDSL